MSSTWASETVCRPASAHGGCRDIVGDLFQRIEKPQAAPSRVVAVVHENAVGHVVAAVGGYLIFAQSPHRQPGVRRQVLADVDVVASVVPAIGIVGQVVVFEAVDPVVVVEVNAKEEFRAIDVVAEKRFLVIWDAIAQRDIVVLVEVRDEVVVFVPSWEDDRVGATLAPAAPIGRAVLIVVVIDELIDRGRWSS